MRLGFRRRAPALSLIAGVILMTELNCHADDRKNAVNPTVRPPAVAGQFYPQDAAALREQVRGFLQQAGAGGQPPRILISPHAGYVFSGPVAGAGFSTLDRETRTVILIGPSHRVFASGLVVPDADFFETPLGRVPVDRARIAALLKDPMVTTDPAAHAGEHSLEVQLPFLQVALTSFSIVPMVTNRADAAAAAGLLLPLIDEKTVVVVSSDFSHYHSSAKARQIDQASIGTILAGQADGALDACGEEPIRIAMRLAALLGLAPHVLDARNSYETAPQYGSQDRVVGYASIVYRRTSAPAAPAGKPDDLPAGVRQWLLELARVSLEAAVNGGPPPKPADVPARAAVKSGCFVTLKKNGELRGCIGYIEPRVALYQAVIENARNAALSDNRFPVVAPAELASITVEISALTRPEPLAFTSPQELLDKLVPGRDGVILQSGYHSSTFLPQVWDQLPDKVGFLEHLSVKGGMPRDGWKNASVKTYRAIHFEEQ